MPINTNQISVLIPCLAETALLKKNKEILKQSPLIADFLCEIGTKPVGKARQALLERAKTEFIFWLDDDIELFDNPIEKLHKYLSEHEAVAGVSCFIMEEDKKFNYFEIERQLLPQIYPKRQGHFMCGLYRKSIMESVGGFDTDLDVAEDHDVQVRLNQKGYDIMCLKDVVVRHHITRDFAKEKKYFEGRKILFNRYGFFQDEHDCIDFNSIEARLKFLVINPKYFMTKLTINLWKKCVFAAEMVKQSVLNLMRMISAEWLKPSECGMLITENCIFKCNSCIYWKSHKHDMPLEKIKECLDKIIGFGVLKIMLVGGEPLLRDDFGEIVDYLKKKKIEAGVVTNGYLGEKKLDGLLKLDEIIISIDGLRQAHNRLRGVDSWDKAVDLAFLLKKKYGKNVKVSFVLQKENYSDFIPLLSFMKKTEIPVDILCFSAGGMGQPDEQNDYLEGINKIIDKPVLSNEEDSYLRLVIRKINNNVFRQKCLVPNWKFMVDARGGVYPCSAWKEPVGNVLEEESFMKLWKAYSTLRARIRPGKEPWCLKCRSCELKINYHAGYSFFKNISGRFLK